MISKKGTAKRNGHYFSISIELLHEQKWSCLTGQNWMSGEVWDNTDYAKSPYIWNRLFMHKMQKNAPNTHFHVFTLTCISLMKYAGCSCDRFGMLVQERWSHWPHEETSTLMEPLWRTISIPVEEGWNIAKSHSNRQTQVYNCLVWASTLRSRQWVRKKQKEEVSIFLTTRKGFSQTVRFQSTSCTSRL